MELPIRDDGTNIFYPNVRSRVSVAEQVARFIASAVPKEATSKPAITTTRRPAAVTTGKSATTVPTAANTEEVPFKWDGASTSKMHN